MEKEKKEIGMEKLIELLCEYLGEEYHGEYFEWYRDIEIPQRLDSLSELKPFIKWLVENDKIDTDHIRTRVKRVYVELEPREFTPQDFTDRVIMLLSISSSPIDDLISYLR